MVTAVSSLALVGHKLSENELQQITELQLTATEDDHGGVIVEMNKPVEPEVFACTLRASISLWRKQGKRGVWIKIPIELVNLVEAAVKQGFWFHHAEPKYLMLAYWIPEGSHTLPANASHVVRVGAFVMNEKREVLVVKEKCGIFLRTGEWKLPTGTVEEGEDVCTAVVREVKEETAIDTEFLEVLAFGESHQSFFQKSELFFLCILRPVSFDIQEQESEILAAQWMPWEEYLAQPVVQESELLKLTADICLAKKDENYSGFSPFPTKLRFTDQKSHLYLNYQDLKRQ
ncbi:hypothetical protein Tsubulata_037801 [Turnera subulata]|uniref:Nudix hydrolase domain-containing protein n=1 Tax=Turnera subulata TaxID=218843 RepID=A0A9Q0JQV6_9ROSI|nr:hypothetical protein Tsubulata_037801 [Turnera subulata]